jgi:hypothetical protein
MGPRLASFGFVVIGIETNSRTDGAAARATQLLAALDYLTQRSPVRDRVDANRLSVMGHSAGGAGALLAAMQRPSLRAVIGLAPGSPTGLSSLANDRVPTLFVGGQTDPTVTPSYLDNLYATIPAATQSAYVQLSGADHLFFTRANNAEIRRLIPWMKIFLDGDNRYTQFMCPALLDTTGVSMYRAKCPLVPPGGSPSSPATSMPTSASPTTSSPSPSTVPTTPAPVGACSATYRTVNSWPGGFQGEVTVTAGSAPISGWNVTWNLGGGQSISQVWNGTLSTNGSVASVRNAAYNGSIGPSASTTFGFLATGSASAPALSCGSP